MRNPRSPRHTAVLALLALCALLGAAAAGAAEVRSGHDPHYDFSKLKTWRFRIEKGPGREEVDRRIRAEVRSELGKKGLRELPAGDEQPDVVVSYAVGSIDVLVPDWVYDLGYFGSVFAYPGASSTVTGGVLIDMGDPKTEKTVWAASYVMRGNNTNALQVMLDRVEKAVRGALKKYPPK